MIQQEQESSPSAVPPTTVMPYQLGTTVRSNLHYHHGSSVCFADEDFDEGVLTESEIQISVKAQSPPRNPMICENKVKFAGALNCTSQFTSPFSGTASSKTESRVGLKDQLAKKEIGLNP